jgi:hypothetical protein
MASNWPPHPIRKRGSWVVTGLWMLAIATVAGTSGAQEAAPEERTPVALQAVEMPGTISAPPITAKERISWIVVGTIGPRSLFAVGPWSAAWFTAWNTPEEWGQTWSGFGKRYLQREADVSISNTLEAGLGAIWGEDPRFVPSHRRGIWPRARFAMKSALLAPRRDGHLAPAWGRYAGNVLNNVIENTWLPPSVTTPGQTALRSVSGLGGRLAGNLWDEFWPDVWRHLRKPKP